MDIQYVYVEIAMAIAQKRGGESNASFADGESVLFTGCETRLVSMVDDLTDDCEARRPGICTIGVLSAYPPCQTTCNVRSVHASTEHRAHPGSGSGQVLTHKASEIL